MGAAVKPMRGKRAVSSRTARRRFTSPLDKANGREVVWSQVSVLFEAARTIGDCRFVYFIGEGAEGPVKIGTAKDPIARLRGMQTGNSRRLRLEHVVMGGIELEKLLHEMWESHAIFTPEREGKVDAAPGTEWFRPEIRDELYPVITTTAREQVAFFAQASGEIDRADLERILREAHGAHGIVGKRRDEVRLLGAHAGYVLRSRRTRI